MLFGVAQRPVHEDAYSSLRFTSAPGLPHHMPSELFLFGIRTYNAGCCNSTDHVVELQHANLPRRVSRYSHSCLEHTKRFALCRGRTAIILQCKNSMPTRHDVGLYAPKKPYTAFQARARAPAGAPVLIHLQQGVRERIFRNVRIAGERKVEGDTEEQSQRQQRRKRPRHENLCVEVG